MIKSARSMPPGSHRTAKQREVNDMTLQTAKCACCGREILALVRERQPVCCKCQQPAAKKQGRKTLLLALVK